MCAQTIPRFILSSDRVFLGNGVETHVNSKGGKTLYRKHSPLRRIEPTTLHQARQRAQHTTTDLFRPLHTLYFALGRGGPQRSVEPPVPGTTGVRFSLECFRLLSFSLLPLPLLSLLPSLPHPLLPSPSPSLPSSLHSTPPSLSTFLSLCRHHHHHHHRRHLLCIFFFSSSSSFFFFFLHLFFFSCATCSWFMLLFFLFSCSSCSSLSSSSSSFYSSSFSYSSLSSSSSL